MSTFPISSITGGLQSIEETSEFVWLGAGDGAGEGSVLMIGSGPDPADVVSCSVFLVIADGGPLASVTESVSVPTPIVAIRYFFN
jgi:hypothetical protein